MSEDIQVQAENQHVAGRLVDMLSEEARDLGLTAFSKASGLHTPESEGNRDRCVVLQVYTKGPGNVSRGTLNPATIQAGDYVVVNLLRRVHDLFMQGQNVSTFNWEDVMARVTVKDEEKTVELEPLQGYVLCQTAPEMAAKIMMGQSRIIAPGGDSQLTGSGGYDTNGKKKEQIKVAIERVVQPGPGAVIDGMWQEPRQKPGDHIMYDTSTSAVRFSLGGQTYTMVHMRHIVFTFAAPTAE